ncbi:MAG TPA: glycosyltransferase family 39 protein [Candidatus Bathyarchaeia archaeon]|nr:glycosyltransferase family 39 protein [Candidatus Bathyarchaeia archaeon]
MLEPKRKGKVNLRLIFILIIALTVRLYKLNIPLADHHSWRQADTASVARNFIKEGFDFLRPKIDNFTPLHAPDMPNSERLFLAEPPIYNSLVALLYYFFGINLALARGVSILSSLGSIIFIYYFVKETDSQEVALWAALFFALLPFSIYYSRVILPEPFMVFTSLGMIYFFKNWLVRGNITSFFLALFWAMISLTQKVFPLFLALPMTYLIFKIWGWRKLLHKKYLLALFIYLVISILPIVLWRRWISQYPAGIPPYDWLFNQGGIRFRPAFFRWIFDERIGKLILGCWGLPFLVIGLALKPTQKSGWFYHWWLVSFLIYIMVFAAGNVTHDYYQIVFVPIGAVFLARGADFLFSKAPKRYLNRFVSLTAAGLSLVFMLAFSWYQVRDFYNLQGGVDLAGKAVDSLTPKDALILTGDSNDASLLYNCNRYGWSGGYASFFPNEVASIEKARLLGAQYFVTTKFNQFENLEFGRYLKDKFRLIKQTDQYIIFDLR